MEFIKRILKVRRINKLRKKKLALIILIKHYKRSSLGRYSNDRIRNDIVKNHLNTRKLYLTWLEIKCNIIGIGSSSKRVNDILGKL